MRIPHRFEGIAASAFIALSLLATPALTAQTIISNETLVTTTFVVNKRSARAQCGHTNCHAKTTMFAAIPVTCPAATGQTCTFHISLDAKIEPVSAATSFYQLLVDGNAPTIGPTDEHGGYLFEENALVAQGFPFRQSYSASVVATVTNSSSNGHTVLVSLGCAAGNTPGGCEVSAHSSTMRVDVFEP